MEFWQSSFLSRVLRIADPLPFGNALNQRAGWKDLKGQEVLLNPKDKLKKLFEDPIDSVPLKELVSMAIMDTTLLKNRSI